MDISDTREGIEVNEKNLRFICFYRYCARQSDGMPFFFAYV